jgi:hypothetical protein
MRRIRGGTDRPRKTDFLTSEKWKSDTRQHSTTNTALCETGKMEATAYTGMYFEFEPSAFAGDVLSQDVGLYDCIVFEPKDEFGYAETYNLGDKHPDEVLKETETMTSELKEHDVDVDERVAKRLEEVFRDKAIELITPSAMLKLVHMFVEEMYKTHREEVEAEIAKEKARLEEARKKEIIAVAVMKKKVQKALNGLFDSPNKEVLQWKLEEMVSTKWPIYSLLAEENADNVLVAIARQYAKFRETHKSI